MQIMGSISSQEGSSQLAQTVNDSTYTKGNDDTGGSTVDWELVPAVELVDEAVVSREGIAEVLTR